MGSNGLTLTDTDATFHQDMAGSLCWMTSGKNAGLAREIAGDEGHGSYPTLQMENGYTATTTAPTLTKTTAISDVDGLQAMNDDLDGNYYLTQDIDASATLTWNDGAGFIPIGNTSPHFSGSLDGCGYTISDLFIDSTADYVGLFGETANASIANLTLTDVSITGVRWVGALAGALVADEAGTIIHNVEVSGSVTVAGASTGRTLGGLVGSVTGGGTADLSDGVFIQECSSSISVENEGIRDSTIGGFIGEVYFGTITNCTSTGAVTGTSASSTEEAGGFIGAGGLFYMNNCHATGAVTSNASYADTGGFIGYDDGDSLYEDCYASGDIIDTCTNGPFVGGFAGETSNGCVMTRCMASGDITATGSTSSTGAYGGFVGASNGDEEYTDCYAWGDITVNDALEDAYGPGGFAGDVIQTAVFTNCYSVGVVPDSTDGTYTVGGFIGYDFPPYTLTTVACFWDTETSGQATSEGEDEVGHTTSWMQTQANYEAAGWDFDTVWEMTEAYVSADITATKITFVSPFPHEVITGDRYCVSGVPFKARLWPMKEKGVSAFNRWDMVGAALKCRRLAGFTSNDNDYWRVSAYRGNKPELEDKDVYIDVTQNPADSAGALNVAGVDLEPYIEQIAAGVTFELTDAEFNVSWTDSRKEGN